MEWPQESGPLSFPATQLDNMPASSGMPGGLSGDLLIPREQMERQMGTSMPMSGPQMGTSMPMTPLGSMPVPQMVPSLSMAGAGGLPGVHRACFPGHACAPGSPHHESLEWNLGEAGWLEGMEQRGGLGLRLTTHWLLRPAHSQAAACA